MARWQLLKAELEGWEVDNLVDAERLVRVRRGVYGAGHRPGWRVARVTDWQMTEQRAETAARFELLLTRRR